MGLKRDRMVKGWKKEKGKDRKKRKVKRRTEALTPMSFIYSGWLADESVCLARLFLSLSSISEAVKALLTTIDFVDGPALAVGLPIVGNKGGNMWGWWEEGGGDSGEWLKTQFDA